MRSPIRLVADFSRWMMKAQVSPQKITAHNFLVQSWEVETAIICASLRGDGVSCSWFRILKSLPKPSLVSVDCLDERNLPNARERLQLFRGRLPQFQANQKELANQIAVQLGRSSLAPAATGRST
jgi:hypothetical protein